MTFETNTAFAILSQNTRYSGYLTIRGGVVRSDNHAIYPSDGDDR